MLSLRKTFNLVSLFVVFGASALGADTPGAPAESTHACCPQVGSTCYMNLDGVIISTPDVRPC